MSFARWTSSKPFEQFGFFRVTAINMTVLNLTLYNISTHSKLSDLITGGISGLKVKNTRPKQSSDPLISVARYEKLLSH